MLLSAFACSTYNIASCLELGVAEGVAKRGCTLLLDPCEWRHRSLLDWTAELIVAKSYCEVSGNPILSDAMSHSEFSQ